jgi:quercetin dioxygenase-like cupin family protein
MVLIEGEFHTTYVGQERVVLKAGDYAYGPGNLAHDGYCASEETCIMFVAYETAIDAIPYPKNRRFYAKHDDRISAYFYQ